MMKFFKILLFFCITAGISVLIVGSIELYVDYLLHIYSPEVNPFKFLLSYFLPFIIIATIIVFVFDMYDDTK